MTYAIMFFLLAQIADIYTTIRGMQRGGVEANQFLAWLMDTTGPVWVLVKVGLALGVAWYAVGNGLTWPLYAAGAVYFAVAVNNWRVVR